MDTIPLNILLYVSVTFLHEYHWKYFIYSRTDMPFTWFQFHLPKKVRIPRFTLREPFLVEKGFTCVCLDWIPQSEQHEKKIEVETLRVVNFIFGAICKLFVVPESNYELLSSYLCDKNVLWKKKPLKVPQCSTHNFGECTFQFQTIPRSHSHPITWINLLWKNGRLLL